MIKTHQVDADTLRVGLSDGSVELREVLLDAEALDEMLVRSFFFFLPLKRKGGKTTDPLPSLPETKKNTNRKPLSPPRPGRSRGPTRAP